MYSSKRNCPPEYKEEFDDILKELVNSFTESWLNSSTGHEIQELWQRRDKISSIELITLGLSLRKLKQLDPKWVGRQINIIKKSNRDGRRGAIYEIILAAAVHDVNNQTVELLHPQTPTYDMILNLSDKSKICISIKNFALSNEAQSFEKNVKSIEHMIGSKCPQSMEFSIIYKESHPTPNDWELLRRYISHIFMSPPAMNKDYDHKYNLSKWDIALKPIDIDQNILYYKKISYKLFTTVPLYKNEEKRIYSNLNKYSEQLNKNGYPETDESINVLFARIPPILPLDTYVNWSINYLIQNPDSSISGFILFQPAIVYRDDGYPLISLAHKVIRKPEVGTKWFREHNRKCQFQFPIGDLTQEDPKIKYPINRDQSFEHYYLYQSGRIYTYHDADSLLRTQRKITVNIKYLYNVCTIPVMRYKGEDIIVEGNFPSHGELRLL